MKLFRKEGDSVQLIASPEESAEKGDYLLVEDPRENKGLIVQVIDVQFANVPGILEDILRDEITGSQAEGEDYDPLNVKSQITLLKDTRLVICKIRGATENGQLSQRVALPSRTSSRIAQFPIETVVRGAQKPRAMNLGRTKSGAELVLDAKALDGRLNIVTGKKGTGKSYLSKLLVLSLVEHGAPCVVLDVNGEYVNLSKVEDGFPDASPKIEVIVPGVNFRLTLAEVGLGPFLGMLLYALDLPGTSARVFSRIWHQLQSKNDLKFSSLGAALQKADCHESVREAMVSRYNTVADSGLFTDEDAQSANLERLVSELGAGGALIVNMKNQYSVTRRMTVEIIINKLSDMLSSWKLRALFLFAEEAHLYLKETYWEDIVTRMRHLGIFTTFVTNQPDTIKESIYRQADNIFLFNFTNEHDLETVSRVAKIDVESVKLIAKDLPPHHCLMIGEIVKNFPIVVNVRRLNVETMGETRYFFRN
ncbi:MAG: DUF87 domain-containing protein [archaeon]